MLLLFSVVVAAADGATSIFVVVAVAVAVVAVVVVVAVSSLVGCLNSLSICMSGLV